MKKILLVDDDPTMQRLLKTLLQLEGLEVIPWTPGEDVVTLTQREKPDSILMDVNLKGKNGFELLAEIRAHPDFRQMQVIMTSGMDYRARCTAAGANGFLLKPFMPEELIKFVK